MSALREAIVLPVLFLTVVLVGAIRPGAATSIAPPTLASLMAAVALLALLVRSGALLPGRLVNPARPVLENLNGVTVLITLFAASAQVVTTLVPESGVPAVISWAVIISLVVQAFVMTPDRTRLLRGLLVILGAAFALKFILLAALSAPASGRFTRALQLLFEGVTAGIITQRRVHTAEGYLAFAAIAMYLVGVALLPAAAWRSVRLSPKELKDQF